MDRTYNPGRWQRVTKEYFRHSVPIHFPRAAAARKPLPPGSCDLVAERSQTFAVTCQTVVGTVAPDHPSKILLLHRNRQVAVLPAPRPDRFHGSGEATFRRHLTDDIVPPSRLSPDMGEAEKVEGGGRCCRMSPLRAAGPKVHIVRLVVMKREPISTQTFSQNVKHALTVLAVFKGNDKIVAVAHQLAATTQAGRDLLLEPYIQHMMQENIGERWANHTALWRARLRPSQGLQRQST